MLHIGPGTAKTHVSRLLTKLNVRDRARLVVLAYESGLVLPGQADAAAIGQQAAGGRHEP